MAFLPRHGAGHALPPGAIPARANVWALASHDGPVGAMLEAVGRSPLRTAHLHVMVTAPGHRRLVTHVFVAGDPLLHSDAVFGVKDSLVREFVPQAPDTPAPGGRDLGGRAWSRVRFDIVVAPEAG